MNKLKDIMNKVAGYLKMACCYTFLGVIMFILFLENTVTKAYNTVKRWMTFNRLEITMYIALGVIFFLMFGCTWRQGYTAGQKSVETQYVTDTVRMTEVRYDTVRMTDIKPVTKTVYKTIRDTLYLPQDDCWKIAEVTVDDLYYRQDSLAELWLKGAYVTIDSLKVYPKNVYTTERIRIKDTKSRWGIGVSAGYGISGPYVGIGLNYNIYTFKKRP